MKQSLADVGVQRKLFNEFRCALYCRNRYRLGLLHLFAGRLKVKFCRLQEEDAKFTVLSGPQSLLLLFSVLAKISWSYFHSVWLFGMYLDMRVMMRGRFLLCASGISICKQLGNCIWSTGGSHCGKSKTIWKYLCKGDFVAKGGLEPAKPQYFPSLKQTCGVRK